LCSYWLVFIGKLSTPGLERNGSVIWSLWIPFSAQSWQLLHCESLHIIAMCVFQLICAGNAPNAGARKAVLRVLHLCKSAPSSSLDLITCLNIYMEWFCIFGYVNMRFMPLRLRQGTMNSSYNIGYCCQIEILQSCVWS
jgi:hypothetical protein